jgi:hypothetical protein
VQQGWPMQPRTQPASQPATVRATVRGCNRLPAAGPPPRRPRWCHRCGGAQWCAVHAARGASQPALLLPPLGPAGAAARPGRPCHPAGRYARLNPPHPPRGWRCCFLSRWVGAPLRARSASDAHAPAAARRVAHPTPHPTPRRGCGPPAGNAAAGGGGRRPVCGCLRWGCAAPRWGCTACCGRVIAVQGAPRAGRLARSAPGGVSLSKHAASPPTRREQSQGGD